MLAANIRVDLCYPWLISYVGQAPQPRTPNSEQRMSLITIAIKSLRQRGLASTLTALSVALGVMLVVAVLLISAAINEAFNRRSIPYDFIVGPKGSGMQLVLSTIYRIEPPIENLPYLYYLELQDEPMIDEIVPVAFGDLTKEGAFPIVGTTEQYFLWGYGQDQPFVLTAGKRMSAPFHAIIGSEVAETNNWTVGTQFQMVHGNAETGHVHDEKFTVVGVLAPTGTADDRTAFVNLKGFFRIAGHETPITEAINGWRTFNGQDPLEGTALAEAAAKYGPVHSHDHAAGGHHHAHEVPDIQKEVTALLVRTKWATPDSPGTINPMFESKYNAAGSRVQAVNPIKPMIRLQQQFVGNIRNGLLVLTGIILIVSGVAIFVSIYNSMSDRLREIGIMRALGARRETVFSTILIESLLLCLCGGAIGFIAGHLLNWLGSYIVSQSFDLTIDPFGFQWYELLVFPALIVLAILAGLLPGARAYQTDVADALSD